MISDFPIDYLHNCLLGIMKKHLDLWFAPKALYGARTKAQINNLIEKAIKNQPSDFHRNIRTIEKYNLF